MHLKEVSWDSECLSILLGRLTFSADELYVHIIGILLTSILK